MNKLIENLRELQRKLGQLNVILSDPNTPKSEIQTIKDSASLFRNLRSDLKTILTELEE